MAGTNVLNGVKGGKTASTPANAAASAAQIALQNFLKVAPDRYITILGTIAAGSTGGGTANAIWQTVIPIVPAFCTAVEYVIQLDVTVTLPASGGSVTVSPFAPYSGFQQQLTLGGAPPWDFTELTPWYFDTLTHKLNYDPAYPGLGNNSGFFSSTLDKGPWAESIAATGAPGTVLSNTGSTAVTKTLSYTFSVRQQLQRKRHALWGSVPFGDPQNRPRNSVQLAPLVGNHPESNFFVKAVDAATAKVSAAGPCNVYATYELAYIDMLPPSITTTPQPLVNLGLQLTSNTFTKLSAGTFIRMTHRTAQIYTSIHHVLVNGELPIRTSYFGLWDDQDQQSARWSFNTQENTLQAYFDKIHRTYDRYFPTGHYVATFENGELPIMPNATPYDALMSPDQNYANQFNIPVTPAMTTVLRIPSGTAITDAYVRTYSFGLVEVPY
jgi:hypothetical protein